MGLNWIRGCTPPVGTRRCSHATRSPFRPPAAPRLARRGGLLQPPERAGWCRAAPPARLAVGRLPRVRVLADLGRLYSGGAVGRTPVALGQRNIGADAGAAPGTHGPPGTGPDHHHLHAALPGPHAGRLATARHAAVVSPWTSKRAGVGHSDRLPLLLDHSGGPGGIHIP